MNTLYFYYPVNIDYMSYLDDYQNTDEYQQCKVECMNNLSQSTITLKEYKSCLKDCNVEANNGSRVVAQLTLGNAGDTTAGIIFTKVTNKELTPKEINDQGLILVTSVQTDKKMSDLQIVDVTLDDLFNPHERIDGKTICGAINDMTNQTLSSISYVVNDKSNPRFIEAECIDIHSKIHLSKTISRNLGGIMYLLEDDEYKNYCNSREKSSADKCEIIRPWMKSGDNEEPKSICQFKKGIISNSCDVNIEQRDKIKAYLRNKINKCIAEMGCLTGTTGENASQKKFMRRHTSKNFPKDKIPTQICCKRSLKAVVKAGLRMDRIYKYVGNMSYEDQISHINNSSMTAEEKKLFIEGVHDSHQIGNKLVKDLNIDHPTQILMESFSIIVRNAIQEQFQQFVELNNITTLKTDAEAEKKLIEITGSEEKSSRVMSLLKSAAKGIVNAILEIAKLLSKMIAYFAKKGFGLLTWIFHHPTTAMWLAYSALFLKKKCCEMISLKIYGSPEIIEVGLLGKSADILKSSADYASETAILIKKTFLASAYDFLGSSSFQNYMTGLTQLIETGILFVISCIPGPGVVIASSIKMSGGLGIILSSMGQFMGEAMYYGFTAIVIKEAGQDIYAIITGTCIKPPQSLKQMTTSGIVTEVQAVGQVVSEKSQQVLDTAVSATTYAAEQANGFFLYLYDMMPAIS